MISYGVVLIVIGVITYVYGIIYGLKHSREVGEEELLKYFELEIPTILSSFQAKLAVSNAASAMYETVKQFRGKYLIADYILDQMATGKSIGAVLNELAKTYYDSVMIQLLNSAYIVAENIGKDAVHIIDTMVKTSAKVRLFQNTISEYSSDTATVTDLILKFILPLTTGFTIFLYAIYTRVSLSLNNSVGNQVSGIIGFIAGKPVFEIWHLILVKTTEAVVLATLFSFIISSLKSGMTNEVTFKVEALKKTGEVIIMIGVIVLVISKVIKITGW